METSLDQKRRELFELHKAKIGTDAPLMRKRVDIAVQEKKTIEPKRSVTTKSKIKYAVVGVTGIVVIVELLFLAKEAGWFKV